MTSYFKPFSIVFPSYQDDGRACAVIRCLNTVEISTQSHDLQCFSVVCLLALLVLFVFSLH